MQQFTETFLEEAIDRVRAVATLGARIAGEVAVRSARDSVDPLAERMGERTAPMLVAQVADVAAGRAAAWCRVGEAVTQRRTLTGEPLPARCEAIGARTRSARAPG